MGDFRERAPRKNIFLAASIEAGPLKAQVRIRNMSESGAMIEGAALSSVGAALVLKRSEIEMGAVVVWSHAGRCGIKFDGVAHVDEWIAGKRLPEKTMILTGQRRVDAIQAAVRLGQSLDGLGEPAEPALPAGAPAAPDSLNGRIAEEIATTQRLLDAVADTLSDEPLILARHASQLQSLQSVSEVLGHLARVLQAPDAEAEAHAVTLHALRARLLRKALF